MQVSWLSARGTLQCLHACLPCVRTRLVCPLACAHRFDCGCAGCVRQHTRGTAQQECTREATRTAEFAFWCTKWRTRVNLGKVNPNFFKTLNGDFVYTSALFAYPSRTCYLLCPHSDAVVDFFLPEVILRKTQHRRLQPPDTNRKVPKVTRLRTL